MDPGKKSANYSLYWTGEENPLQHGMTDREVFNILSKLLEETATNQKPEVVVQPKGIRGNKTKKAS
ncbi:MAG: hypothetical protein Q8R29_01975 [bacterium]|nr:hypothetical protein [bacterium]